MSTSMESVGQDPKSELPQSRASVVASGLTKSQREATLCGGLFQAGHTKKGQGRGAKDPGCTQAVLPGALPPGLDLGSWLPVLLRGEALYLTLPEEPES